MMENREIAAGVDKALEQNPEAMKELLEDVAKFFDVCVYEHKSNAAYNEPESYVELILTGRMEEYLNTVREGQKF